MDVESDVARVSALLDRGAVREAAECYEGPCSPTPKRRASCATATPRALPQLTARGWFERREHDLPAQPLNRSTTWLIVLITPYASPAATSIHSRIARVANVSMA
jgi:hypothetical protein